ncbi:hypothetical protein NDU88_007717 [Pleurodeles waltl]|uniref:Uncharacterized protein n=1 Tax=Pleurodeles waltl TaxID=8319 RepID=A0AAV7VUF8_PLEWA|nr:hypothetical protein NDU88_007717 [Pleurodeles waltl]
MCKRLDRQGTRIGDVEHRLSSVEDTTSTLAKCLGKVEYEFLEVLYDAVRQLTKALRREIASYWGGAIPFQDIPSNHVPCKIIYFPFLSPYRNSIRHLPVYSDPQGRTSCSGSAYSFSFREETILQTNARKRHLRVVPSTT